MTIAALIQGHLRRVSRKRQSRLAVHGRRHFDDQGMTLTELLIASTLLIVLLTVVMLTMNVVDSVTTSVGAQYQEFDQALPALAPLQQLLRAQVERAPTPYPDPPTAPLPTSPPTPPFASIGNYSLTFYANIGMADGNVATEQTCTPVGGPPPYVCVPATPTTPISAGPAKIVAGLYQPDGAAVTEGNQCPSSDPCSFQVRERLPIVSDDGGASTCPVLGNPSTDVCQYPPAAEYKLLTNALHVTNTQPVFTYTIFDPCWVYNANTSQYGTYPTCDVSGYAAGITPTEIPLTSTEVGSPPSAPGTGLTGLIASNGYPTDTQSLTTCAVPTASYPTIAISCPLDAVQRVEIDLMISVKGSSTSPNDTDPGFDQGTVENQTIVYRDPINQGALHRTIRIRISTHNPPRDDRDA